MSNPEEEGILYFILLLREVLNPNKEFFKVLSIPVLLSFEAFSYSINEYSEDVEVEPP